MIAAQLLFVWRAFWDLNHDRPLGFGITDPDEFERLYMLISDMDGTFMTEMASRCAAGAMESARLAHEKIALLQSLVNAHQMTQAERLVCREVLREV